LHIWIINNFSFCSLPGVSKKYEQANDKGLYWEMIKMEIRAFIIAFSKKKAKRKRNEESILSSRK